jgi:Transport and Golgi organisation 2
MCTVIFIPGRNKFQFASLRDENPLRPKAIEPVLHTTGTASFVAPIDALAGGTWAGLNQFGNVIILLNGAHANHTRQPYYCKSRGLIVKELLQSELPVVDWNLMDLTGTEPFTLVVWSDWHLFELVWDGQHKTKTLLDKAKPHIWSSATLYNAQAKAYRNELFHQWISNRPMVNRQSLLDFFHTYQDAENGFLMNRNCLVKTLSYSFIEINKNKRGLYSYHDLMTDQLCYTEIPISETMTVCDMVQHTIHTAP